MNPLSRRRLLSGGLNVLGAASATGALGSLGVLASRTALAASSADITTSALTPKEMGGLTLLQGAGCNVVAMPGPDGALLIDGGLAANSKALLKAVEKATGSSRVNTLINTHWHPEQTGSNLPIGSKGGVIIAHEVTRLYEGRKANSVCFQGTYGPLPEKARATKTTRTNTLAAIEDQTAPGSSRPANLAPISRSSMAMPTKFRFQNCMNIVIDFQNSLARSLPLMLRAAGLSIWNGPP